MQDVHIWGIFVDNSGRFPNFFPIVAKRYELSTARTST
jgi:hypothetical protein